MRNSIRIPISKMIKLLKEISSGGRDMRYRKINSKIAYLLNHEITLLNAHFVLTEKLLMKQNVGLAANYHILFRECLESIFLLFFKITGPYKYGHKNMMFCVLKNLPNYRLYMEAKNIINHFLVEEERQFQISKITKNYFILNSFMDNEDDERTESNTSTNNEENDNSINNINNDENMN